MSYLMFGLFWLVCATIISTFMISGSRLSAYELIKFEDETKKVSLDE